MENKQNETYERIRKPDTMPIYGKSAYDDGNIPSVDLPKTSSKNEGNLSVGNVIPDEVPRKDGPGGEDGSL